LFPLTHAYTVCRLVPGAGPLHILGAIFPDAVLTNGLDWGLAHQSGAALYEFLGRRAPAGRPFAVGMITHGIVPAGLDYYGDREYAGLECGYSFEEARPYAAQVAALCRLPASMGLWKAHNFVEMALEWLIARQNPGLEGQVRQAFARTDELAFLSPHLATFFEREDLDLVRSLPAMLPFLALEQISPDSLAERYQRQVRLRHGVEAIAVEEAAGLIAEIAVAIQPRCWAFLEDVLGKIGAMLEREGWKQ
jgi:hypothetical protein